MPEPETFPVPTYRFWGQRKPPKNRAEFWNASTEAPAEGASSTSCKTATLRMYGPIDSFGGWFGISAKDVAAALDSLPADVNEIRVRINSPGGEAFEGMAILNMLRAHQAKTVAVVDGLAASAASFLASGLDETVMSPGSQMMIHDAAGLALGQASDMRKMAEALDSVSNSIASIYAEATGETTEEWRAVMVEETWYTADEAVTAGLADQVAVVKDSGRSETAGGDENPADAISDAFDLSIFNYAGRDEAPAPHMPPSASAVGSTQSEGGHPMSFTDDVRTKLGVAEDADEATILAALTEALDERADPPLASQPTPQPPAPQPDPSPQPPAPQPQATASGTMVLDQSAWDEMQARIKRMEAQEAKRKREERDEVIAAAIRDGKFLASRAEHYKRVWDADPEGARQLIDGLTKGVVPVNEIGHAGDDDSIDDEFGHLFPPSYSQNGA